MIRKLLNSIASDGGDMTTSKKELAIATLPIMKFDLIKTSTELLPSLAEIRKIIQVSYTAAANTDYEFVVEQRIDGILYTKNIFYTSDSDGTDADIATALIGSFNAAKDGVKAVATGAATPITFTADAKYDADYNIVGEPLFNITVVQNTTATNVQANHTSALRAGSITDATPCVVTAIAHGLQTGDKVILAAITTATILNDTWRVTVSGANTYSLDGSVEGTGGAGVGAATAFEVAQASRGWIGDLIADGIDSGDITASAAYSQISFEYADAANTLNSNKRDIGGLKSRLYVSAHSTTSPGYTATTNYSDFAIRIEERLKGIIAEDIVEFVGIDKAFNVSGEGTWTVTRGGQGDYYLRRTANNATDTFGIDITAELRTATAKGFKLNSFDVVYGITAENLDGAVTATLDRIEYSNNVAVSTGTNSIAITGTLATNLNATGPYVTEIAIDAPLYDVTDDSKYVLELTVDGGASGVFDFYGLMLKFTKTDVDYEVLGNL